MPTERIEEILDRLAEMEYALPGLRERSPATAAYVEKELRLLITECRDERDRWQSALDRARALADEPAERPEAISGPHK
jgi:hypothetical protein